MDMDVLTAEQLQQLKEIIRTGAIEIEIHGGKVVLIANCRDKDEPSNSGGGFTATIEQVASTGLRYVASASAGNAIDIAEFEGRDAHEGLFALAGHLREAVRLVESRAAALDTAAWPADDDIVHVRALSLIEEQEGERAEE